MSTDRQNTLPTEEYREEKTICIPVNCMKEEQTNSIFDTIFCVCHLLENLSKCPVTFFSKCLWIIFLGLYYHLHSRNANGWYKIWYLSVQKRCVPSSDSVPTKNSHPQSPVGLRSERIPDEPGKLWSSLKIFQTLQILLIFLFQYSRLHIRGTEYQ